MPIKFIIIIFFFVFLSISPVYAQDWKELSGRHFVIYYKKSPQDFVKSVEQSAETYYDEIARNLAFTRYKSWSYDQRALIYIYDDAQDYVQEGRQANWSHGVAYPKDKVIRTYPSAHGFFDSTLPHEIGHIIFREFVGFKARIPSWFEEGVAMYQEKAKRFGSHDATRVAIKNKSFIPLPVLNFTELDGRSDPKLVELFYTESASIVNYLITELGQQRFVAFCRALQDGTPFEWALKDVYIRFKDLEDLNKAWISFLQK